jgi:hypothetical protein
MKTAFILTAPGAFPAAPVFHPFVNRPFGSARALPAAPRRTRNRSSRHDLVGPAPGKERGTPHPAQARTRRIDDLPDARAFDQRRFVA